jgi:hypothetical protein
MLCQRWNSDLARGFLGPTLVKSANLDGEKGGQILNPPMSTCEECPSGARCIWSEQKYSRGLLLQAKQKILKMKAYEAGSKKNSFKRL